MQGFIPRSWCLSRLTTQCGCFWAVRGLAPYDHSRALVPSTLGHGTLCLQPIERERKRSSACFLRKSQSSSNTSHHAHFPLVLASPGVALAARWAGKCNPNNRFPLCEGVPISARADWFPDIEGNILVLKSSHSKGRRSGPSPCLSVIRASTLCTKGMWV